MTNLDIDSLRAFASAAETRGFAAAAAALGVSPGVIRAHIRRLEQRLGQQLFKRSRRTLALTRHGEVLMRFASRMLELNDEGVRLLTREGIAGTLHIGASEYFVPHHLPHIVARFARAYPQLAIVVRTATTAQLLAAMQERELDLVVGARRADMEGGKLMFREPLYWVGKRGLHLQQSEDVALVSLNSGCAYRQLATNVLTTAGRGWRVSYESSSVAGIQHAVNAGLGVACLPLSCVQRSMRILGVGERMPALPDSEILLYAKRDGVEDPAVAQLVALIRESLPRFSAEVMTRSEELAEPV